MPIAEQCRHAADALSCFVNPKLGRWFPETVQNEIDYWRSGIARTLVRLGVGTIHEAYREVPTELTALIAWCRDIAGMSRQAA